MNADHFEILLGVLKRHFWTRIFNVITFQASLALPNNIGQDMIIVHSRGTINSSLLHGNPSSFQCIICKALALSRLGNLQFPRLKTLETSAFTVSRNPSRG